MIEQVNLIFFELRLKFKIIYAIILIHFLLEESQMMRDRMNSDYDLPGKKQNGGSYD
jgi:hypothetical protein